MAFMVSPGIIVTETDLTAGASQVSVSDAAFAGPFQWGPALVAQNIESEDDLVQLFGKPEETNFSYWFCAQSFLAYSNQLHAVRALSAGALNATLAAKTITGNVAANGANFIANGAFVTTGLLVGQTLVINAVNYIISAIVNSTAFATTTTPDANVTNKAVTAYGVLVKNAADYETNFVTGSAGIGGFAAKYPGELGNTLKVSICPSASAFANTLTGTVTLTAGSNTVTGSGTNFVTDVVVGDYLIIAGQTLQVGSITNSIQIITATAATVAASAVALSRQWEYAAYFDRTPGTSAYASLRLGANDEMHVIVTDKYGLFTGKPETMLERYAFVSKASDAKDANGDTNYYVTRINRNSKYLWWMAAPGTLNSNFGTVAAGTTFVGDAMPTTKQMVGGQTDNLHITDGQIQTGYDVFKSTDQIDVSLIMCGPASAAVATYIINNICEARADCMAFVSPLKINCVNNAGAEVTDITTFRNLLPSSSYAMLDSGWKYQYDKYNDVFRWVPLNGDMAGIAARSDTIADPWFSPAGFVRGNVKNVIKLSWNPSRLDRDGLYKQGINPVASFPEQGTVLYGDKTLLSRPSAFDRINVRRLFIVIEKTISRLSRSQLFEFNDEFTRAQFRNSVEPYLRDVKARRGVTDYRVICDDSNNTDEVVQQNRFVGDIYVKPAHSINFIQLNFVAVRSGVSFQEIAGSF